ncbi:RpnC/YadD family protein [Bacillus fonticola]|uniref:Rpn family recombination-promoting nuclease/putative transposase n=1 Tax=Bacillus fonticola TaxID=2728853 RepID=UPI001474D753|nr:Rpn family recombination-promoting nuclease/putative transposase [Bacillus fonticola]
MSNEKIDHDRLFKELLSTFFEEFILLFFPHAHEHLEFANLRFLSEELYSDVSTGEKYRVDLLVETKMRGETGLVIVHVEPQSYVQKAFNERMFIYYSNLYQKYRTQILPIAMFTDDTPRSESNTFSIQFPFADILQFQYQIVDLKKHHWRDYVRHDNPVAAALMSKMGYTDDERIEMKKEFLRMLIRLELDPARMSLVTGFFETYVQLDETEEQQLKEEVSALNPKEGEKIMEVMTSYERRGREEGREEGVREGKIKVAKNLLEKQMDESFIAEVTGLSKKEIQKLR